jgi:phosphonate transport system substrate-binding protein
MKVDHLLRAISLFLSLVISSVAPLKGDEQPAIQIGITPVFLNYQTAFINDWRDYLSQRMGRNIEFVQRNTYREITNLLLSQQLDFAWICGFPYMRLVKQLELMAVPVYQGEPLYRSYLIVPAQDKTTLSIKDLQGRIFAYSDPDSNSGYLVPNHELARLGQEADTFFKKSFFTWSHEKVVEAVAHGVANGGAVDGYVWDTLSILQPELTQRTRIVSISPQFGFPPIVARRGVGRNDFNKIQELILNMDKDPEGLALLKRLNLDDFVNGSDELFAGIAEMMEYLGQP